MIISMLRHKLQISNNLSFQYYKIVVVFLYIFSIIFVIGI